MTRAEASALIDMLKDVNTAAPFLLPKNKALDDDAWLEFPKALAWHKGLLSPEWETPAIHAGLRPASSAVSPAAPAPVSPAAPRPTMAPLSKLTAMAPLLDRVPEGYYCPLLDESRKLHFFRVSRPKTGTYRGTIKIQKVIGSVGSHRLETIWVRWPAGDISVYADWEDEILGIITDYSGSARRYAKELGHCCRCNAELTDERSRRFGIGPECEKYWPWIIEEVLAEEEANKGA
jgi:hypothetical protein